MNGVSDALSRSAIQEGRSLLVTGKNLSFRRIAAVSNVDKIAEYGRHLVVS